ncbi:MAG: hypothetical protein GX167_00830 [Firmicutes bacterium]|jgi:hypothetical protein|nr:hypothetical protein [Bacillota bacterium]
MSRKEKITVFNPRGNPSGVFGGILPPGSDPGAIHDPFTQPTSSLEDMEKLQMAPRLDTIEGKAVYLVETGFPGSAEFMEEIAGWFSRNIPSVKTMMRSKGGAMWTDNPELWAEIKEKGDAVIIGVGG